MAIQGTDLLLLQSQVDSELYKLKVSDLDAYFGGSAGVDFKGSADLNLSPSSQGVLPASNGDLYLVKSDANPIASGWDMEVGVTSVQINDRIIWDDLNGTWIVVANGGNTGGTITDITATLPLESDGDSVNPVLTIRQARTITADNAASDGKGTKGAVARLAESADVAHTTGTGASDAVVTADLLKATNDIIEALPPGGVETVTTTDVNNNGALEIGPTTGDVVVEIKTASTTNYGVVQVADASDIANETAGPSAIVDASQLAAAISPLPTEAIVSITEDTGASLIANAMQITVTPKANPDASMSDAKIAIKEKVFCPYDFSSFSDLP